MCFGGKFMVLASQNQDTVLIQTLVTRIFLWVLITVITVEIGTGLYLHNPALINLPMHLVREIHRYTAYIMLFDFILYSYYYLITGYYHTILFKIRDIKYLPGLLKYTFFLNSTHPFYGKYNPGQKLLFSFWILLICLEMFSGFALAFPNSAQGFFVLAGGMQRVRLYHYLGMVIFSVTILLHLYLVFTEDPAKLQAIFTGRIKKS